MKWRLRERGLVMGIVNVTPDSFSDGGRFLDHDAALARALTMIDEGAEILDIGGESTRPGAEPVPLDEEVRRVLPLIRSLRARTKTLLSIDTMKPEVARQALAAGADIVNDVGGWRDPAMLALASEIPCGWILMHMRGEPRTMQRSPEYADVTADVLRFFDEKLTQARTAGVDPDSLVFDPGIGFGKTLEHNLRLLADVDRLVTVGPPVCVGVSRKSFLEKILGTNDLDARYWPTVALTSLMREAGALIFRVHDVRGNVQALRMTEAVLNASA